MYHNKRQKTANFTGTSSISQSIFTSLSHSAIIVTYVLLVVNASYQQTATFFWRKTAILYLQKLRTPAGARAGENPFPKMAETWGFYYGSLGVCLSVRAAGPAGNLSSVSYPQAVDNYGSLGVWEPRSAAEDQRAPGRLSLTIAL